MTGTDPIVAPTGQLLPGGLRALGIGAIPSNAPATPADLEPPAPPPMPDQAAAALLPPPNLAPPPGAAAQPQLEAPKGALPPPAPAHPFGASPALLSYLQGRQPPPDVDPLTGQAQPALAPVGEAPSAAAATPAPTDAAGAKAGKGGVQPAPSRQVPASSIGGAPPTLGQAYGQTQDAAAAQVGAVANEADVAAKQADATLKAREDADRVLQTAQEQLRARIERDQQVLGQKQAAVEAANKEVDNYKIDPNRYWKGADTAKKVGWYISMALSGIGDALQGKSGPNPVIGMLQSTIENDVKLQMDQRDALRAKAQRAGQALDSADRFSQNRFAQEQYMLAQAYTMAGRQIETAAAKYGSEAARAQGASAAAAIYSKAAEAGQKAAEYATTDQRQKEQLAEQKRASMASNATQNYAIASENKRAAMSLAEERRWHDLQAEREQRKMDLDAAVAAAKLQGKDPELLMKQQKENEERGIVNPITAGYMLRPEGQAMVTQAEKLESAAKDRRAAAAALPDGSDAKARALAEAEQADQRARAIRGEAEATYAVRTSSTEAAKVNAMTANTQTALETIDRIKELREKNGAKWFTTTEGSQALDSLSSTLSVHLKEAFTMGALDKGSLEVSGLMSGGDPNKITAGDVASWLGAKGSNAALDTLARSLEDRAQNLLGGARVPRGSFKFKRASNETPSEVSAAAALRRESTPVEIEDKRRAGLGRQVLQAPGDTGRAVVSALTGGEYKSASDLGAESAQAEASSKYPGLAKAQEPHMDELLSQARGTGERAQGARARLIAEASETAADRPAYSAAVLNVLKAEAPQVYKEAIAALPDEARAQRQDLDLAAREAQMANAKTDDVIKAYRKADPVAWDELQRRSTTDPKAAAIMNHPQNTAGVADLERLASGGDAIARQELARRAYGEIQRKGTPTSPAEVAKLPAYSALLRVQGGAAK